MANKSYRYPDISPVGSSADAGLDGLGINWNRGGEGVTPWVDYIKFQSYRYEYNGKAIMNSFKVDDKGSTADQAKKVDGDTVYLYMPSNIAVSYAAGYNNTSFGVGGIMAAQMLGGTGTAEEVAGTLQNAAAGATPEAGFNAVSEATNAISRFLGLSGDVNASALAAVSQGKVFNPYEEQIFTGITFRPHNFQFKLIARDKKEAEDINEILKFFKRAMLPSYDATNSLGSASGSESSKSASDSTNKETVADKLNSPFSGVNNRYLNVPSRFTVDFIRVQTVNGKLGAVPDSSTDKKVTTIRGLFKIKDCVVDGVQINYTPDGGYVNTNDEYVPAIDLSISLKEVSIVTSEDIDKGF